MNYFRDNQRMIFGIIFITTVFLLVEAWTRDQRGPLAPTAPSTQSAPQAASGGSPVPAASPAAVAPPQGVLKTGQRVTVRTNLIVAEIDLNGGDLRRVELLRHRDPEDRSKNFVLLQDGTQGTYVARSGLTGEGQPNHNTAFNAEQTSYELAPGRDEVEVLLTAPLSDGGSHTKSFRFRRGSYLVEVELKGTLATPSADLRAYFELVRDGSNPVGSSMMMPTYTGGEVYTEAGKMVQLPFGDVKDNKIALPRDAKDGWIAVVQHYFLGAWLPRQGLPREYYAQALDAGLYRFGAIVPVDASSTGYSAKVPLYVGPQEQQTLKQLALGLEFTVDYGMLRMLAVPIFWILEKIHEVVKNWGVAIIVLTILIKLVFYPLSAASYRSMGKMKLLAPKLQRLKERYGDDRQKMHQAVMDIYKTEKVNPLGGCLPILVQIPVFIALYWVLLLSVELRQAPFMLWINDLSVKDPYYVLPILMGITMYIQTFLNPTPPDPIQARLMKIMPVAFSIFFFFFPAGLVLYWLVNNILSIAQQWQITRAIEREKPAHEKN